jgi:hypothetical protein
VIKPWPAIVAQYAEYVDRGPAIDAMLELTQHIANSPLASGLYGWTSMFDLFVTQTEVAYPYDGPRLRVAPLFPDGRLVELRYLDTMEENKQWCRTVEAAHTVPRFLKFLDQLHWFPTESLYS